MNILHPVLEILIAVACVPLGGILWRHKGGMWNPLPGRNLAIRLVSGWGLAALVVGGAWPVASWWQVIAAAVLAYPAVARGHGAHQGMGSRLVDHGGQSRERTTRWIPELGGDRWLVDFIGMTWIGVISGVLFAAPVALSSPVMAVCVLAGASLQGVGYALAWKPYHAGGPYHLMGPHWLPDCRNRLELSEWLSGMLLGAGIGMGWLLT